jgi:hypothetical protein
MEAADSGKGSPTCRFCGIVTGWRIVQAGQTEYAEVTCEEIARWHLARMAVYGTYLYRVETGDNQYVINSLPVFNERKKASQYYGSGGTELNKFITPDYNSENGAQKDGTLIYGGHWRLGDILNYLRAEYNLNTGNHPVLCDKYLSWPLAVDDVKYDFLFDDGQSPANANKTADFALGGMSLAEAIDTIVTRAGPYGWWCEWDDSNNIYNLMVAHMVSGTETTHNLTRGSLGGDVVGGSPADVPDVASMTLEYDWDDARNSLVSFGAKKRFELTVDNGTDSGDFGGLIEGWDTARNAAWRADGNKKTREFQSFFQRYLFKKDIDWSGYFNNNLYFEGAREPLPTLLSSAFQSTDDDNPEPTKLKVLAWRYKSATWEPMPEGVSLVLLPEGGIMLSGRAPNEQTRWADDGSGGYPIRVTIAVEADERLTTSTNPLEASGDAEPLQHWPHLQQVVDNGDEFLYEARTEAYLPVDASGDPVIDDPNSYSTLGSASSPDVVRDDQAQLDAATQRTLDILSRPEVHGEIVCHDLRFDMQVGDDIGSLTGGGNRPNITLNAVIGKLEFQGLDTGRHQTVIEVGTDQM